MFASLDLMDSQYILLDWAFSTEALLVFESSFFLTVISIGKASFL